MAKLFYKDATPEELFDLDALLKSFLSSTPINAIEKLGQAFRSDLSAFEQFQADNRTELSKKKISAPDLGIDSTRLKIASSVADLATTGIQNITDQYALGTIQDQMIRQTEKNVREREQSLNAVLLSLVTGNDSNQLPEVTTMPSAIPIQSTAKNEAEFNKLKDALTKAYPDQKIDISFDRATGAISGTIPDSSKSQTSPNFATPGFQPDKTLSTSFDSIKKQIEEAQTAGNNNLTLNLAFKLKQIATDQGIANYSKFLQQANTANGIPDLEAGIAQLRKFESTDPNNPRDGRISDQRLHLLQQLGQARNAARVTLDELMKTDTVTLQADNFANSVISRFKLSDDELRTQAMQNQNLAQQMQIEEFKNNPKRLDRLVTLTTGNINPDQKTRDTVAQQLTLGKMKLDPFVQQIISMDSNDIRDQLLSTENKYTPTQKLQMQNVLLSDEIKLTGNEALARKNIRVLEQVVNTDLSTLLKDQSVPAGIRTTGDKEMKDLNLKGAMPGSTSASMKQEKANLERQIKQQILQSISVSNFNSDVSVWKGVIQADPIAKQVMETMTKPGEKITAQAFIAQYINYNDKRQLREKVASLRGIVQSASDAMQGSSVLPDPSGSSMILLIDKMGAQTMANFLGSSLGLSGVGVMQNVAGAAIQSMTR